MSESEGQKHQALHTFSRASLADSPRLAHVRADTENDGKSCALPREVMLAGRIGHSSLALLHLDSSTAAYLHVSKGTIISSLGFGFPLCSMRVIIAISEGYFMDIPQALLYRNDESLLVTAQKHTG